MYSPEPLKGTLQTILLKVLKDHGKMYGYEITQRVKELSKGRILLTEGSLYPMLHRLEAEGMLKTEALGSAEYTWLTEYFGEMIASEIVARTKK